MVDDLTVPRNLTSSQRHRLVSSLCLARSKCRPSVPVIVNVVRAVSGTVRCHAVLDAVLKRRRMAPDAVPYVAA